MSAKLHRLYWRRRKSASEKIKKGEVFVKITGSILEHVAKILGWTNDGYEQGIILAISEWLKNIGK